MKRLFSLFISLILLTIQSIAAEFSDNGGTYVKVTAIDQIQEGDILIIASWAKTEVEGDSKVRIMTTTSSSHTGYFDFYTYDTTCNSYENMPTSITLNATNNGANPYEYKVRHYEDFNGTAHFVYLNDDNNNLLSISNNTQKKITKQQAENQYCKIKLYINETIPCLYFNESQNLLKCENYTNDFRDNGCFTNTGSTQNNYNNIVLYRKSDTQNVQLNIGATGYATLYYGSNDIVLPEGLKAYTIALVDETLRYTKVFIGGEGSTSNTIPKNTAVMLSGTPNTAYALTVKPEGENNAPAIGVTNILKGSDAEGTTTGSGKYYKLSTGSNGIGFYYGAADGVAFTNAAHKAYLLIPESQASKPLSFALPIDNDITETSLNKTTNNEIHSATYDLGGRFSTSYMKGIKVEKGRITIK